MRTKLLTPEERRQRRLAHLRNEVATSAVRQAQVALMLHQHEQLQQTINAVLARWANEILALASTPQETPHDH